MASTIETADIGTVRKGDIVRFVKYALRVEAEPKRGPGTITLHGSSARPASLPPDEH